MFLVIVLIQKPPGTKPLERGREILGQINYFCLQRDLLIGRISNAKVQIRIANVKALRMGRGKKGAKPPGFFFLRSGRGEEKPNSFSMDIFRDAILALSLTTRLHRPYRYLLFDLWHLAEGWGAFGFSIFAKWKRAMPRDGAKMPSLPTEQQRLVGLCRATSGFR